MTCLRLQPGRDDSHVAALVAQFHVSPLRRAVAAHDIDKLDALIGGQGCSGISRAW